MWPRSKAQSMHSGLQRGWNKLNDDVWAIESFSATCVDTTTCLHHFSCGFELRCLNMVQAGRLSSMLNPLQS